MSRAKLIAGNWKMYKNVAETADFLAKVEGFQGAELLLFAQSALLSLFANSKLAFGPQNIYWEEKGAFTGELSPKLAKELGASYALAGHSERRQFFGETHHSAAKRALAAHAFGMTAVFCVGERLEERDSGQTMNVIRAQCAPLFEMSPQAPAGFCFAYEPVWAIGTGRTATSRQAEEVHAALRAEIAKHWGEAAAQNTRILYGGSVKPDNAKELMSCPNVDGVLVGGASLEAESFLAIARAAKG